MMDLMRLPLGILTGMGFIGGGAILKKGDVVIGVTTAATLWYVTILGLCFGGGQTALGIVALAIGMIVLSGLKRIENHLVQDWRGLLILTSVIDEGPTSVTIRALLRERGLKVMSSGVSFNREIGHWIMRCDLRWHSDHPEQIEALMKELSEHPGVIELNWSPQGLT
jgi:putative Mg2+ transporter-C (MgtC) family protein